MDSEAKILYSKIAKSMIETLLQATDKHGMTQWRMVQQKNDISLYRSLVGSISPCNSHAVCDFDTSIESIMDALVTDTTDGYRRMMRQIDNGFVDGTLVHVIIPRSKQHPHRFVGVKWSACKRSSPLLKMKDYLCLEYTDVFPNAQGGQTGFRVFQSIHLDDFTSPIKATRSHMPLTGYIFYTSNDSPHVRMTYTCNFDSWTDFAGNLAIQSHMEKQISRMKSYITRYSQDDMEILVSKGASSNCGVCRRRFSIIKRHRHGCQKCGQIVCGRCSAIRIPIKKKNHARVCTICLPVKRRESSPFPSSDSVYLNDRRRSESMALSLCSYRNSRSDFACATPLDDGSSIFNEVEDRVSLHNSFATPRHQTNTNILPSDSPNEPCANETEAIESAMDRSQNLIEATLQATLLARKLSHWTRAKSEIPSSNRISTAENNDRRRCVTLVDRDSPRLREGLILYEQRKSEDLAEMRRRDQQEQINNLATSTIMLLPLEVGPAIDDELDVVLCTPRSIKSERLSSPPAVVNLPQYQSKKQGIRRLLPFIKNA